MPMPQETFFSLSLHVFKLHSEIVWPCNIGFPKMLYLQVYSNNVHLH